MTQETNSAIERAETTTTEPGQNYRTDAPHFLKRKRSAWRQHLVLTERGVKGGIRSGSAFFIHFFGCSIVLATGYVLNLSLMQWVAILMCMTFVLSAEMFNQALCALVVEQHGEDALRKSKALNISTAAVMLTVLGGLAVVLLIYGYRVWDIWAG